MVAELAMSPAEIQALHESAKMLQGRGPEVATKLYDYFFEAHPELKFYFSTCFLGKKSGEDGKTQVTLMAKVMAHILFQLCINIDDLGKFSSDCERVSAKHVSRGIKPEFYPYFGDALIKGLKDVMGDDTEVLTVWRKAYDHITAVFAESEKRLTAEMRDQPGGWEGFRKFKVAEAKEEQDSRTVTSDEGDDEELEMKTVFYLEPVDGNKTLPIHHFGQYVCVRYHMNDTTTHRNYTLQAVENGKMIIAVKHMDETPTSKYMIENWKVGFEVETSCACDRAACLTLLINDNMTDGRCSYATCGNKRNYAPSETSSPCKPQDVVSMLWKCANERATLAEREARIVEGRCHGCADQAPSYLPT
ncbi:Flavohemoprotein [Porphyridium purpureum]|uniref:Flavohemoprotein n=1 Tax=Porphyridium purpureum TaxID=35688 RepID=A0A5J4Z8H3_PORPP|nr:Flavohemoprotein [Porphyridium purpureum]|eukprot:POR7105..scf295_1